MAAARRRQAAMRHREAVVAVISSSKLRCVIEWALQSCHRCLGTMVGMSGNRQLVILKPVDYAQAEPVEGLDHPAGWVSGSVTQQSKHPNVGLRLTPNPSYSAANNSSLHPNPLPEGKGVIEPLKRINRRCTGVAGFAINRAMPPKATKWISSTAIIRKANGI